jgi:hypothetical protein
LIPSFVEGFKALKFEFSPEEMFWQEKMIRQINECNSMSELKEMATLLAKIATQRQVAIKGLVKDAMEQMTAPFVESEH